MWFIRLEHNEHGACCVCMIAELEAKLATINWSNFLVIASTTWVATSKECPLSKGPSVFGALGAGALHLGELDISLIYSTDTIDVLI
jgi:hypothetical protein